MLYKVLALIGLVLALLFTTDAFRAEGVLRGPDIGGLLAVSVGNRTVTLAAHNYRPGRTYFCLRQVTGPALSGGGR